MVQKVGGKGEIVTDGTQRKAEYLRSIFYISNFPLRAREKAAHLPTFSAGPIIANLLFALVYHSI